MNINYDMAAKIFKAFCDPSRLMILELLQTGEKCACVLQEQLNIPQSTLAHHMKVLCESDIVVGRKEGKWTYYSISEENSIQAIELLGTLIRVTPTAVCNQCD
ncbi:ArsR/SmtB family transcription factor [Aminipila sp.]|uniref:ArsR/SmtB family transcription factor n=1 Tax=Aminipila sp. TaxID=2060095 RepID=UPI002899D3DE|nr:metalloregulator ArsR/SmtB family transcription factor [Aminipila sp.]